MRTTPKTIQIFLPQGDPQGIRVAEITTRIVQVIEVPRRQLSDFGAMHESSQVGVYFLFGESEDTEQRVYIGQTGDLRARLTAHHRQKEFWSKAIVLLSRTNSLTQTHALFLEWYCLDACRKAGRIADENGNSGSKPHTPLPLEADCLEIFDTAKTLLSILGHPVFDPVSSPPSEAHESLEDSGNEIYYCKGSDADGRGQYTNEGFVVLEGSSGRMETTNSLAPRYKNMREKLISSDVTREKDGRFYFLKNHLFNSPSSAATTVMGRTANGWSEWVSGDGRTLDEVVRRGD